MAEMVEVHICGHGQIPTGAGLGRQHGDTREKPLGGWTEAKDCSDVWGRWIWKAHL